MGADDSRRYPRGSLIIAHHLPACPALLRMTDTVSSSSVSDLPAPSERPFNPRVAGVAYGVLDELIGYAIRRVQIRLYEDFHQSLAPWQITPQRFSALVIMSCNPGLKLTELAHIQGIARSGAVVLIDGLVELGHVERRPSPTDRRALGLFLTRSGQQALEDITAAVKAHDARMSQRLSPQEAAELHRLLDKMMSVEAP